MILSVKGLISSSFNKNSRKAFRSNMKLSKGVSTTNWYFLSNNSTRLAAVNWFITLITHVTQGNAVLRTAPRIRYKDMTSEPLGQGLLSELLGIKSAVQCLADLFTLILIEIVIPN